MTGRGRSLSVMAILIDDFVRADAMGDGGSTRSAAHEDVRPPRGVATVLEILRSQRLKLDARSTNIGHRF
jgi:hypothetical protein